MFYILLAVALIAALTYAVNRNSRTSGDVLTSDKARLAAQEIISFSETVSKAVDKLRLRGISETQIDFENTIVSDYSNAACSAASCRVFAIGGGNINYTIPDQSWLNSAYSAQGTYGRWLITGALNIDGSLSASPDLLLLLPYVSIDACEAMNTILGLNPPTTADTFTAAPGYFTGGYTAAASPNIADAAPYSGQDLFCVQRAAGEYFAVKLLWSR